MNNKLSMTEMQVLSDIKLDGQNVATVEVLEYSYYINWPTGMRNLGGFKALIDFYYGLKHDFGDDYRRAEGKLFDGTMLFDVYGKGIRVPLEEFLDESAFQQLVMQTSAAVRVNTPYGDLLYDIAQNNRYRKVGVASHLDLSRQLPYLMQRTHATHLPQESLPELQRGLSLVLGRYGR